MDNQSCARWDELIGYLSSDEIYRFQRDSVLSWSETRASDERRASLSKQGVQA